MQRLWGVDRERCKSALDALVEENVPRLKSDGASPRLMDRDIPRSRRAKAALQARTDNPGAREFLALRSANRLPAPKEQPTFPSAVFSRMNRLALR